MKLNRKSVFADDRKAWEASGFNLPEFNIEKVERQTLQAPQWVHFGCGNIFKAFPAVVLQKMLNEGEADTGLIAVAGFGADTVDRLYVPHDNLSVAVSLKADGSMEKTVVASVVRSAVMEQDRPDFDYLKEVFRKDSLQMASFTITEKGYKLTDGEGKFTDMAKADFEAGPDGSRTYMARVTALCYERYLAGEKPVTLVSMDNFSHNGDRLKESMTTLAFEWENRGLAQVGFTAYLKDADKVSFPWSVIDKITPGPSADVEQMLKTSGLEDAAIITTPRNSKIANFVNAEEPEYLVIEDTFTNGRPALEKGGVIFTDRETVDKFEKMKVCTCLNPLHTALAVFGCLLSHVKISEEMKEPLLKNLVKKLAYEEGLPVVTDPGIVNPAEFLKEVLEVRFTNPFIPDTPQRIAMDTSQKIPIRFGETIKAYMADGDKAPADLTLIPLVIAGWLRYLLAVNDEGEEFTVSSDPLYEDLKKHFENLKLRQAGDYEEALKPILTNEQIFAVDLYEAGLAPKILDYFGQMMTGPGAVRATLEKYVLN